MSGAHLHLVLNHLPILGTVFGLAILAWGTVRRQAEVQRVALGLFVFAGAAAGAAYWTGESAEEMVEGRPGVSHAMIEAHEEVALYALIAAIVLGVAALGVLWIARNGTLPMGLSGAVVAAALVAVGVMAYTANQGGKISHPELRSDAPPAEQVDAHEDDREDD